MLRLLLASLLSASVPALQQAPRPSPEAALAQKLASPFLRAADWTTDYEEALRRAADEQRLVFGYFTTAYP